MRRWLIAVSLVVVGCSGPVGSSGKIKATEGGTVTAAGLLVTIPPGALAADSALTVAVADKATGPDAANTVTSVFTLGPDGTQFSKPVSLALDFDGATPPSGKKIAIAFVQGGAWQALADSAVSGTKVTATTTHFSQYAIVWVDGQAVVSGCSAIPFTACGGDPSGLWTIISSCHAEPVTADKFSNCPGSAFTLEFTVSDNLGAPGGKVNLTPTGAAAFGSFGDYDTQQAWVQFTGDIYVGPAPCASLPAACAAEAESYRSRGGATLGDVNGQCMMTNLRVTPGLGNGSLGTYNKSITANTNAPNTLRFYGPNGSATTAFFGGMGDYYDYCVQGNAMTLSGSNRRFQLTK